MASIVTGRPVKWVEDRIENLSTTAFARDFHMETEIACTKDGKVLGLRCYTIADHGAFDACANATKWPAGLFSIISGSYDFPVAHCLVDGVYTNKGKTNHVGHDAEALRAEMLAYAPESSDHFVEDEENAVRVTDAPKSLEVAHGRHDHSA